MLGNILHYALKVLPLVLVGLLRPNKCRIRGVAGDGGDTGDYDCPFGDALLDILGLVLLIAN